MTLWPPSFSTFCAQIGVLLVTFTAIACGNAQIDAMGEVAGTGDSRDISQKKLSFATSLVPQSSIFGNGKQLGDHYIHLRQSDLNKYFLLSPTVLTEGSEMPFSYGMPKVVYFQQDRDTLLLFAAPNQQTKSMPYHQDTLLQTFPILQQNSDELVISFRMGMATMPSLSALSPMVASDDLVAYLPLISSYVPQAYWEDNDFIVEQHAQVAVEYPLLAHLGIAGNPLLPHTNITVPLTVFWRFSPFVNENPFAQLPAASVDRQFGLEHYFQLSTLDPIGWPLEQEVLRWDLEQGPVEVVLTDDLHEPWRSSVVEAIEYWNRALEQNVFVIRNVAKTSFVAAKRQVYIDWISSWAMNYSYAAFAPNPATGELLLGRVVIDGAYFEYVSKGLEFDSEKPSGPTELGHPARPHRPPGLAQLLPQHYSAPTLCKLAPRYKMTPRWQHRRAHPHRKSNAENAEDDMAQALLAEARDSLLHTVGHELGHILGLRHNFAGSLQGEPRSTDAQEAYEAYFDNKLHRRQTVTPAPSSTVMDYLSSEDSAMLGDAMRHKVLPYDAMAVQSLYKKANILPTHQSEWLFCTDEDLFGKWYDCGTFDSGKNPILDSLKTVQENRTRMGENAAYGITFYLNLLDEFNPKASLVENSHKANAGLGYMIGSSYRAALYPLYQLLHSLSSETQPLQDQGSYWDTSVNAGNRPQLARQMLADKSRLVDHMHRLDGFFQDLFPIQHDRIEVGYFFNAIKTQILALLGEMDDLPIGSELRRMLTSQCLQLFTTNTPQPLYFSTPSQSDACRFQEQLAALSYEAEENYLRDVLVALSGANAMMLHQLSAEGHYNRAWARAQPLEEYLKYFASEERYFPGLFNGPKLVHLQQTLQRIVTERSVSLVKSDSNAQEQQSRAMHSLSTRLAALRLLRYGFLPWSGSELEQMGKQLEGLAMQGLQSVEHYSSLLRTPIDMVYSSTEQFNEDVWVLLGWSLLNQGQPYYFDMLLLRASMGLISGDFFPSA